MYIACIILVLIAVNHIHCRPTIQDSIKCFNHTCSEGATTCEKYSSVSNDRKYLDIEVKCSGKTGVLDTFIEQVNNPHNPSVSYHGYELKKVIHYDSATDDQKVNGVDIEHIESNSDVRIDINNMVSSIVTSNVEVSD